MLTSIIDVQSKSGNFKVKLRKQIRYLDMDKCNGCVECTGIYPVEVPSEFDADLGKRKAIYKIYDQTMLTALIDVRKVLSSLGMVPQMAGDCSTK